jgi:hypothetical protein
MLVFFGISDRPDIAVGWTLTQDDVVRARKLLHEGAKTKPDEIGTIELGTEDVVRNPLIKKIEEVFDNLEENKK